MSTDIEKIILDKLRNLEDKLDHMMRDGCMKADTHKSVVENQREIFGRLNIIEKAQAEGKGKLAVAMVIAGAAISLALQYIGKRL
jgi:hypothetical protein